MFLTKEFTFDAAHRLPNHAGKCKGLHGHTYKVQITVDGPVDEIEGAPSEGMVLDFGVLKDWWKAQEPDLDHCTVMHQDDPLVEALIADKGTIVTLMEVPPTAENLVLLIRDNLAAWLSTSFPQIHIYRVRVYETPTSWAEA